MIERIRVFELQNVLSNIHKKQALTNCYFPERTLSSFAAQDDLYLTTKGQTAVFLCDQGQYYELFLYLDEEMNWPDLPNDRPLLVNEPVIDEKEEYTQIGKTLIRNGFYKQANNLQMIIDLQKKRIQIEDGLKSGIQSLENIGIFLTENTDDRQMKQIYRLWIENLKKTDVPINHYKLHEKGNGRLVCALNHEGMVCGSLWWNHRGTRSEYRHIVVEKELRQKGIASFLLYYWGKRSLDSGCKNGFTWVDQNNQSSLQLQRKIGFTYSGRHTYQYVHD